MQAVLRTLKSEVIRTVVFVPEECELYALERSAERAHLTHLMLNVNTETRVQSALTECSTHSGWAPVIPPNCIRGASIAC